MRYDEYLASGYPIASGVIEGACRNVVKGSFGADGNELDYSWRPSDAGTALYHLTEQWDAFIEFRIARETERLYPYRDTLKTLPWQVAA